MKKYIRPIVSSSDPETGGSIPISKPTGKVKKLFPILDEGCGAAPMTEDMGRNEVLVREQLKRDISHFAFKR